MHIPDSLMIHGAAVNTASAAISLAAACAAMARVKKALTDNRIPLLGVTAAFIFAAQMLNFPIGLGTSGHFLGALLAAILLGPASALLVMIVVLLIQCLLLADGGVTTLGTNILNMGIIAGVGGYGILRLCLGLLPAGRKPLLACVAVAAWASVVLSASACAVELAAAGTIPLHLGLPAMAGTYAVIGVGESIITVAAVSLILSVRPDLLMGIPQIATAAREVVL